MIILAQFTKYKKEFKFTFNSIRIKVSDEINCLLVSAEEKEYGKIINISSCT